ncbi:hypothetical protein SAMN04488593_0634 [Microbacterium azadirachtae]|nr:hypothetical protein SAMN04488593_0634 [Microbacterium azadirachtae]SEF60591.1 hypothetical protein SAMN04488594_0624 [Microbacterium azadirachtae]SEF61199.1 hypothetical protein SAMN04488592_0633 [Microbacterium azadirachtae]
MVTREECLEAFAEFLLDKADELDERERERQVHEPKRDD